MSKEAMKLALEAYCKTLHPLWNTGISRTEAEGFFNAGFKAAEAISKQEQGEPVAMRYDFDGYGYKYIDSGSGSDWQTRIKDAEPVYAKPQPKQEQGEPVAIADGTFNCNAPLGTPLYATPQQRKPLTDEQIRSMEFEYIRRRDFARAIEAAHGIKE